MLILPILAWGMVELNAPAWCWWCWGITVVVKLINAGIKLGED